MGFSICLFETIVIAASRGESMYINFILIVVDEELKNLPAIVDRKKGAGPYKALSHSS